MKAERESSPELCGSIRVANPIPSPSPSHPSPSTPKSAQDRKSLAPPRRRGTVACRRCRRLRTKCLHGPDSIPPCEACRTAGPQTASECSFPRRGEKDIDRDFRRRQTAHRLSVSSSSTSHGTPATNHSAPAVQPLPAGASVPVDAPIFGPPGSVSFLAPSSHHTPSPNSTTTPARPPNNRSAYETMSRRRQGSSACPAPSPCFPSHQDIVAGCRSFVTSYFQLGFLPKAIFIEAISRNANAISPFLLSGILGISARFTPALVHKYGSSQRATENFLRLARMMVPTEMYEPTLERTQAFFLLAIAEWGNGDKDRSSVNMGIAVRMASILKLHREESYLLPLDAPPEQVIRAESARRTFWMIHSQENLHAGYSSPAPFPLDDITARLPCEEHDFAFGISPSPRYALPGTLPAQLQPDAATSPRRCLFATLIQSHNLWGQVARRACRSDLKTHGTEPWEPGSEYQVLTQELRRFEADLPERHRWSPRNLRGWRLEQLHLAYLAVVMVLRVSNIVERRIYLDEILFSANNNNPNSLLLDDTGISPKTKTRTKAAPPEGFWKTMSDELFAGVVELHEQIDAFSALRTPGEGFPAILVFCVYICGSLASYLWRYPQLCPRVAGDAEAISLRCLRVLGELHQAWPTSTRWQQGLQQIASPMSSVSASSQGGSVASGDSPPTSCGTSARSGSSPAANRRPAALCREELKDPAAAAASKDDSSAVNPRLAASSLQGGAGGADQATATSFWDAGEAGQGPSSYGSGTDAEALSNELFEAEMRTLLNEDVQFAWLDFEHGGE